MNGTEPGNVFWKFEEDLGNLIACSISPDGIDQARMSINLSRRMAELASTLICVRQPCGFDFAYRLLFRHHLEGLKVDMLGDRELQRASHLAKSVRRDCHKMTAFVRFRQVAEEDCRRKFVAWFEPDHDILERMVPFFQNRFGDMDWDIVTPDLRASCRKGRPTYQVGHFSDPGIEEPMEQLWKAYYFNIFNPARLKTKAMQSEMPKKYWRNLPEAILIPDMIENAEARVRSMREREASKPSPKAQHVKAMYKHDNIHQNDLFGGEVQQEKDLENMTIEGLEKAAHGCTRCPLYENATQLVFGEGPNQTAELMFVGEQPGDKEDLAGKPFVGPAGQLFQECLIQAGLGRDEIYITNAVKHFKHEQRGKRRIHQSPSTSEIDACKIWLEGELVRVKPKIVVALGASATRALTGDGKNILKRRGSLEDIDGLKVFITIHPSAILRIPDLNAAAAVKKQFTQDLMAIRKALVD